MKRVARRENILVWGPPLYHYTSLSGFKGIIESRGFWASDSRFLNDAHEMRHGAELAAEVLSQIVRRSRVPAFRPIAKAVRDNILRPPKVGHLIACFSTLRDSLEQWRGYGGSGGVCIGVGVNHQKQRAPMFYGSSMLPHRVFYSARAKQALVLSLLRRFEIEYRTDMEAMRGHWPDDHDQHYVERLTSTLSGAIVGFKNLAFGHEAEVRVVLSHAEADDFGGLKFRPSPLGLVPYLCTGDRLENAVSIENVMVGPSPHQELIASSVRTFLDHHGYTDIPVDLSTIPYRGPGF